MRAWMTCCAVLMLATGAGLAAASPALTQAVHQLAERVLAVSDHGLQPFAIVDKRAARLVVFHGDGRVAGSSAVLLGREPGDRSMPGVGERTQRRQLRPEDATTPAGRFVSQPGPNHTGESVVWLDPDAAFALHRVRPGPSMGDRERRLASKRPGDRRVSLGCVVVPVAFFERVVQPLLGRRPGVVYVLPEQGGDQHLAGAQ